MIDMETLKTIVLLAAIPGSIVVFVICVIWSCIKDARKQEKEYQERLAKDEAALAEEMLKPKYVVSFEVRSSSAIDLTEDGWRQTQLFDPYNTDPGSCGRWNKNYLATSKEVAERHIKDSYERGWFKDSNGITYPVHNISTAYAEESKNDDGNT